MCHVLVYWLYYSNNILIHSVVVLHTAMIVTLRQGGFTQSQSSNLVKRLAGLHELGTAQSFFKYLGEKLFLSFLLTFFYIFQIDLALILVVPKLSIF